ncbi:MAG: hypothetical protein ACXVPU_18595 [Bacteroidia bacterium]
MIIKQKKKIKNFFFLLFVLIYISSSFAQKNSFLDTLKISINLNRTIPLKLSLTDKKALVEKINEKLNKANSYLQIYANTLTLKDSDVTSYYIEKKQELSEIIKEQNVNNTKDLDNKKEKTLLELSLIEPAESLPYYIEWLKMIYAPAKLKQIDSIKSISKSDDLCFYQAYLYSLLIKRFPDEKNFTDNLGITYYNHGLDILNSEYYSDLLSKSLFSENEKGQKAFKQEEKRAKFFLKKAKPLMEKWKQVKE